METLVLDMNTEKVNIYDELDDNKTFIMFYGLVEKLKETILNSRVSHYCCESN
ncbi:hypothetical protein OnM2_085027 [Erysiphe neolycopersici]|uniref:Uncharacterized protein n=1 Tax=Erysiphe neolycopersici TaxID=212602 RepID=A0A420HES1_9PEZI|nr:hypothetical protein OnM2_085027 [Erysiphe neolycopersici]